MDFDEAEFGADQDNEEPNVKIEEELFGAEGVAGEPGYEREWRSLKDSVIFLVDCRKATFDMAPQDDITQFEVVMNALSSFMKTKIISNENDKIGLILYNVKNESNVLGFKGINRVFQLDTPDAQRIKIIENLFTGFDQKYGSADKEIPFYEALWLCNHELKSIEQKIFNRRIFIFTPEDNPHISERGLRDQAYQHARHLTEMNVEIELFPLKRADGRKFDVRKFYVDLIAIDEDEANKGAFDMSNRIMELGKRIRQREYKKRMLGRVDFALAPEVKIGVKFYSIIHESKLPSAKMLDARTNKILQSTAKYICNDTGSELYDKQIGNHFELGNEKILFNKDDTEEIKKFDEPGLKLMGFKPRERIKNYQNIKSSYFLYPDDQRITGSSQIFDSMIKQLIAKDKVAIVRFVPRRTSMVRFCALFPQAESYDADNFQTPPGFNLIFLPYADDIRKPDTILPATKPEVTRDQITNAKLLVKSLTFDFDSRNFENPKLQNFFSSLQAIALGENNPEPVIDTLMPDEEGIKKYAEVIENFKLSIYEDSYVEPNIPMPKSQGQRGKKKAEDDLEEEKPMNKKAKATSKNPREKSETTAPKRGGRKKYSDEEEDEIGPNDYDYADNFIIDDRPKSKRRGASAGGKRGGNKMIEDFEEEEDYKPGKKSKGKGKKVEVVKMEIEEEEEDEVEMFLKTGEFARLKVQDLKDYLKSKGLPQTGRKEQLIEKALNYLTGGR